MHWIEYSEDLAAQIKRPAPEGIAPRLPASDHSFEAIRLGGTRKWRCVCCQNAGGRWRFARRIVGNVGRSLPAASEALLRAKWKDVELYLKNPTARATVMSQVVEQLPESPMVVVGHSLGSVVSLEALGVAPDRKQPEFLVTLGSPLRHQFIRNHLRASTRRIIRERPFAWLNVHDHGDPITGGHSLDHREFAGTLNLAVNNGSHEHDIDHYLRHPLVARLMADVAVGERSGRELQEGLSVEDQTLVNERR